MWRKTPNLVVGCLLLIRLAGGQSSNQLESQLRHAYTGQVLFLRGFYPADTLNYAPDGTLKQGRENGDWTVDGIVRVKNLNLTGDKLTIDADRAGVAWTLPGFGPIFELPSNDPKIVPRTAHIEIGLSSDLKDL